MARQARLAVLAEAIEHLGGRIELGGIDGEPRVCCDEPDTARGYAMLRDAVAVVPMLERDSLVVGGPDRLRFLQGLLTQDVSALTPGHGCYAGLLTPKGKLVTDARIAARADDLLFDLPWRHGEGSHAQLDRYLFRDKVTLSDTSTGRVCFLLAGPALEAMVTATLGLSLPAQAYGWRGARVALADVDLVASDWTGPVPSLAVWCGLDHARTVLAVLVEAARGHDGGLVGTDALEQLRLEAGVPRFGQDLDDETIPLEAARISHMLSFTKGCYVGQEIIARVDARGAVNRHLVGLVLEGAPADAPPPPQGALLLGSAESGSPGKELGRLTTVGRSPRSGRTLALGWVRRDFHTPGTVVDVAGSEGLRAMVTETPFEEVRG